MILCESMSDSHSAKIPCCCFISNIPRIGNYGNKMPQRDTNSSGTFGLDFRSLLGSEMELMGHIQQSTLFYLILNSLTGEKLL